MIENGKIIEVRNGGFKHPLNSGVDTILDASGNYVMPGGIDPHTHLSMPFMGMVACDDYFSGHAASLAGGTTFHIDFALPIDHDLMKGYREWTRKANDAIMDYGFHMAVTSWSDKVAKDMETLVKFHGINSFKFFMAYKGALMVTDSEMLEGFTTCKELGALPQVHAENGDAVAMGQDYVFNILGIKEPKGHALSRPEVLEAEATGRAIRLAEFVGTPLYIVHVMGQQSATEIAMARLRGSHIIGETVTSAISLDESCLWNENFTEASKFVMSPPIRSAESGTAVKAALAGGILQLLGTDHAVFNSTQKGAGKNDFRLIPNGVNGIEERMHIAWEELVNSGMMTPMDFVRVTSTEAAKVFNIYPQKGTIGPGSDADVVIFDPNVEHVISAKTHHSRIDTNVYEGRKVRGKVVTTISRGRIVWHNGVLNVTRGSGRFISLKPFGSVFHGLNRSSHFISHLKKYESTGGTSETNTAASEHDEL